MLSTYIIYIWMSSYIHHIPLKKELYSPGFELVISGLVMEGLITVF